MIVLLMLLTSLHAQPIKMAEYKEAYPEYSERIDKVEEFVKKINTGQSSHYSNVSNSTLSGFAIVGEENGVLYVRSKDGSFNTRNLPNALSFDASGRLMTLEKKGKFLVDVLNTQNKAVATTMTVFSDNNGILKGKLFLLVTLDETQKVELESILKSTPARLVVDLERYTDSREDGRIRDAVERLLLQHFSDNAEVLKTLKAFSETSTEDLLKLSVEFYIKAQTDKSIKVEDVGKMDISFMFVLLQTNTSEMLNKIAATSGEAKDKPLLEFSKMIEGIKAYADLSSKLTEIYKTNHLDFTAEKAYEIYKGEFRSVIEVGRK